MSTDKPNIYKIGKSKDTQKGKINYKQQLLMI